jgi:DNA-binding transcriptional ArsR family regulator
VNNIPRDRLLVLHSIITSKTRIRILMSLFLNPERSAYLRELSEEFAVSPSLVKTELQSMRKNGLLTSEKEGKQILYRANQQHPLFPELNSMVRKALGMDHIIESIVQRLGELESAFLLDDYAEGKDTGIIDLLLVGQIDQKNLSDLVKKTEHYISRKIRTLCLTQEEYTGLGDRLARRHLMLLWKRP